MVFALQVLTVFSDSTALKPVSQDSLFNYLCTADEQWEWDNGICERVLTQALQENFLLMGPSAGAFADSVFYCGP